MFLVWFFALISLLVVNVSAYKTSYGKCTRVYPQSPFNMEKMLGQWYVLEATSTSKQCLTNTITEEVDHSGHYLLTETYSPSSLAKFFGARKDNHRTGFLKPLNPDDPGVMTFKHPTESAPYTFTVLMTDYNNYAVIYACKKKLLGLRRWSAMILSRTSKLSLESIRQLRQKLADYDIDTSSLSVVDHTHCNHVEPKKHIIPKLQDFPDPIDQFFKKPTLDGVATIGQRFNDTKPVIDKAIDEIFKKPQDSDFGIKEVIVPNLINGTEKMKESLKAAPKFIPF